MENKHEWYLIEIKPAGKADRSAGNGLKFETPAVDKAGAEWLAKTALIDLAQSKDIETTKLASTVTPCKDC